MPDPAGPRVLAIDDDRVFLEIAQFRLRQAGYRVEAISDPQEGLNRAIADDFDVILLDLTMPGLGGGEMLSLLKPFSLQHKVVVMSAHRQEDHWARMRDLGAAAYIQKPVDYDVLCRAVDRLAREKAHEDVRMKRVETRCRLLDALTHWVFDTGDVTPARQVAALGVAGGLLGVLVWLVL